jgi:hypothetical protein
VTPVGATAQNLGSEHVIGLRVVNGLSMALSMAPALSLLMFVALLIAYVAL